MACAWGAAALCWPGWWTPLGMRPGLQQKYQGYLLSETALTINGESLPAGAYGFGFIANDSFRCHGYRRA